MEFENKSLSSFFLNREPWRAALFSTKCIRSRWVVSAILGSKGEICPVWIKNKKKM